MIKQTSKFFLSWITQAARFLIGYEQFKVSDRILSTQIEYLIG